MLYTNKNSAKKLSYKCDTFEILYKAIYTFAISVNLLTELIYSAIILMH